MPQFLCRRAGMRFGLFLFDRRPNFWWAASSTVASYGPSSASASLAMPFLWGLTGIRSLDAGILCCPYSISIISTSLLFHLQSVLCIGAGIAWLVCWMLSHPDFDWHLELNYCSRFRRRWWSPQSLRSFSSSTATFEFRVISACLQDSAQPRTHSPSCTIMLLRMDWNQVQNYSWYW